jgi:LacI family transcriptional regulator
MERCGKKDMATIIEIANLAGVSPKTVSRVLSDHKLVKPATRDRVLAAVTHLDYHPARGGRQSGANTLTGLLLDDPAGGYQTRFHQAMLAACAGQDKSLVVEIFDQQRTDWQDCLRRFLANTQIRELVLLPTLSDFGPLKSFLKSRGVNCVLISPSTSDNHYPSVAMDDHLAARQMTEHLLRQGHTRIAHIGGHPDHAASLLRRNGFYEAFDVRGTQRPPQNYMEKGDFSFDSGYEATMRLLGLSTPPTSIFACNDEMAAGACAAALRIGVKIPESVCIAGFDDAPVSVSIWPPLTTIRQPYAEMAKRSVEILATADGALTASDRQVRYVVSHDLIIRGTTFPLHDSQG